MFLLSERRCAVDQWDATGVGRNFQEHADLQLVRALQLIPVHVVNLLPARRSSQMICRDRRKGVGFSDSEKWVTLLVKQDAPQCVWLGWWSTDNNRFARRTCRATRTGRTCTVGSTGRFNPTGKASWSWRPSDGLQLPLKSGSGRSLNGNSGFHLLRVGDCAAVVVSQNLEVLGCSVDLLGNVPVRVSVLNRVGACVGWLAGKCRRAR